MLYLQTLFLSILASILKFLSKTLGFGAGTSISGLLVEKYFPSSLRYFQNKYKYVIYISGTNGKTTTTTTLFQILKKAGVKVNSNIGGANIFRGIAGQILRDFKFFGGVKNEILLIECEEATLPKLTKFLPATHLVLLNIFRDQLDVYGELDVTLKYFKEAIKNSENAQIIINGDDSFLMESVENIKNTTLIFGVKSEDKPLYEGENKIQNMDFWIEKKEPGFKIINGKMMPIFINYPSTDYNLYNYGAAVLTALNLEFDPDTIIRSFEKMESAFGRGEKIEINGKTIELYLIKNPAGAYSTIKEILKSEENFNLVFGINDRIADGKDVSWIWDIPLENMNKGSWQKVNKIWVLGSRRLDIALRLKHAHLEKKLDLNQNLENFLEKNDVKNTKFLLTYTALRETRGKIGEKVALKKIDEI